MKLNEVLAKTWKDIKWNHSSDFEAHYEKVLHDWIQGLKGKIKKDMKLYYGHYAQDVDRNHYQISFLSRYVGPGGGVSVQVFPSAIQTIQQSNDYEVYFAALITYNGAPMFNGQEMSHEEFLETMQLVDMDISQLHDDPAIQKKLQARLKKK